MIRAQHVLAIGQKACLGRGGAPALDQQPGLNPRLPADQPGQVTTRLVIAHHRYKGHGGTKRGQVAHHIARTARHGDFAFHCQHRHRRFRADALRPAVNIAVQHGIAHHKHRGTAKLPRRSHQLSDGNFNQWPIHAGAPLPYLLNPSAGSGASGSASSQAPASVSPSIRSVGQSVPRRKTRSLAAVRFRNICFRLPATVISLTASASTPSRIMKPAAPRL